MLNFSFLSELWELLMNGLTFILFLTCSFVAMFVFFPFFKVLVHKSTSPVGLSPNLVKGILTLILVIWALMCANARSMSVVEVLEAIFPTGDYVRIGNEFDRSSYQMLLNRFSESFIKELLFCFIYSLPVIMLDLVYALMSYVCKSDKYAVKWVSILINIVSVVSVYVIMAGYDTPQVTLPVRLVWEANSGGLWKMVLLGLPIVGILAYVLMDLLSNNLLLAIYGFQIAGRLVEVELRSWQQIALMMVCFGCGYIVALIRDRIEVEKLDSDVLVIRFKHGLLSIASHVAVGSGLLMLVKSLQ